MPRHRELVDPVERAVADALDASGVSYVTDPRETRDLDFFLPDFDVYIECKQMFAERITKQMKTVDNIIVIQGLGAALSFAQLIRACGPE